MFAFFKKLGHRGLAIKNGRLIDMEKNPYRNVNEAIGVPFALAMSPAAFSQFVALQNTPAHKQLEEAIRWGNILTALASLVSVPESDQIVFNVNVIQPDGVLCTKSIKAVTGYADDGRESLTFLLEDEIDPLSSSESPVSL
jgi:hypothetical protein